MFWELVDNGLAECAAMSADEYQQAGAFMTFLCCTPDQTEENLQLILNLQRKAEAEGVTESELLQAKSKICSHIVLRSERPANRLMSVGSNWIQRHEYRTVRETVQAYQSVTCRQIADVLKKYPLSINTTVAVGPIPTLKAPQ
jgi:predicted Zn-dependent peptidase